MANTSTAARSLPAPANHLNAYQQRILAEIIEAARRKPGPRIGIDRNRCSYCAWHVRGRIRWSVKDAFYSPIAAGECR